MRDVLYLCTFECRTLQMNNRNKEKTKKAKASTAEPPHSSSDLRSPKNWDESSDDDAALPHLIADEFYWPEEAAPQLHSVSCL